MGVSVSLPATSDHFDGERYYNPTLPQNFVPSISSVFKLLLEGRSKWPKYVPNTTVPQLHEKLASNDVAVTFVNHATSLLQISGLNILTDPVWSRRVSPFRWLGPARVRKPGIAFDELPNIDLILLTHNHYDHMDLDTLTKLNQRFAPTVLVSTGNKTLLRSIGFEDVTNRLVGRQTDQSCSQDHFRSHSTLLRTQSVGSSEKVSGAATCFTTATASSTLAVTPGTPATSRKSGKGSGHPTCLLGIGAYAPRWFVMKPMHMNPEEAVRAHQDLESRQSIGMHFGTFQLSSEAIDQPKIDLEAALSQQDVPDEQFVTLAEGETRIY